ncbi:hypothetical protein EDB81DRAFT_915267 [Dactylonectria macrodidyma]|uniref:DUF7587 domain-containing protein n=1 Tax=Dactylonectria macrodidyma TaxID=307937 RepID=A0A9P9DFQ5_9HYPO|nr:hypothetical protein EDB81DRAFT_915267 [Dactylonectria macrodidyma]
MEGDLDLDYRAVQRLLLPSAITLSTEEWLHSWLSPCCPLLEVPLLRLWDSYSGSQPSERNTMESRDPNKQLDTAESRIKSLTTHINHATWEPTPYISFTSSPQAITKLASLRNHRNRGPHTLTAIHPRIRRSKQLPILDVEAEMNHYNIPDPYHRSKEYYKGHYVCIWKVTEAEIVGHWSWDALNQNPDWYDDIVLPAFEQFGNQQPNAMSYDSSLSNAMANLSGLPCYWETDSSWDTDDEVEEANRSDDIIKIIEGDW